MNSRSGRRLVVRRTAGGAALVGVDRVVLSAVLLVAACSGEEGASEPANCPPALQAAEGRDLGDLFADVPNLRDGAGEDYSLAQHCGDVLLLAVGGQWCPPCREEMPLLADLHGELADQGLSIVFVLAQDGAGDPASPKTVLEWEAEFDPPFAVVADTPNRVKRRYANELSWPVTILVDRSFVLRYVEAEVGVKEFRPDLERLLAGAD